MSECDVLIVGAGPVGALAGLLLVNRGFKVIIIEKEPHIIQSPRALGYLPQVNGILEEAGILQDVREAGWLARGGMVWRRASDHAPVSTFYPSSMRPEDKPQGHLRMPVLLGQHIFADIVLNKFHQKGGQTLFSHAFESLNQEGDKVHTTVKTPDGTTHTITSSFVLGADGGRSSVRKALGTEFEGFTHNVNFVAINIRYPQMTDTGFSDVQFLIDPQTKVEDSSFAVIIRIDKDNLWRVAYGDAAHFSEDELKARIPDKLKKILPLSPDPSQYEILRAQPYRVHQRCAASYTTGRVILMGDAAHLNNPVGGLGLNTGLLDAYAATLAIADCTKLTSSSSIDARLKEYSDLRRAAFLEYTNPASIENLRRLMERSDEADQKLRSDFFASMEDPEFQRGLALDMNRIALGVPGLA